jgi:hypothetical protein
MPTEHCPEDHEFDDYYDDDDDYCYWCGGDGDVECPDPLECTHQHLHVRTQAGHYVQFCACASCNGSGNRKDMTIW